MSNKVACILLLAACTGSGDERVTTESPPVAAPITSNAAPVAPAPTPAPVSAPVATDSVAPTPTPTSPTVAPARVATTWRDRVRSDLAAMKASAPQLLVELTQLAPSKTRAGFVRFTSDAIHDPRAASVFLDRLARGGDSDDVRAALVEALPRTGGTFADAAVELMGTERSSVVRAAYVHAARRAPGAQAIAIMTRGLADGEAEVQAEAARSAAAHPEGKRLASALRAALASSNAAVRAESARTLGILKVADARDALAARISDESADVRLEALRATERIAPGSVRSLPLDKLAKDEDPRIVALVGRLTAASAAQ